MNLYDFTALTRKGEEVPLRDYKGKLVLVVNTATGCGFTPQYEELQAAPFAGRKACSSIATRSRLWAMCRWM